MAIHTRKAFGLVYLTYINPLLVKLVASFLSSKSQQLNNRSIISILSLSTVEYSNINSLTPFFPEL